MLKHPKLKRYLSFWLYVATGTGVPVFLIADKYGVFTERAPNSIKITAGGVAIFIIVCCVLKNWLQKWVFDQKELAKTETERGFFQSFALFLSYIKPSVVLTIAYAILYVAEQQLEQISEIVMWSAIANAVAALFIAYHDKVVAEIHLEKKVKKNYEIEKALKDKEG